MAALFSTLVASSATEDGASNSNSIATVFQLYTSECLNVDISSGAAEHALLSYQAIEVGEESSADQLSNSTSESLNPNLGVWNCRVSSKSPLVDQLMTVRVCKSTPTFCFTVDLKDPTKVEPSMSLLQGALIRHLIQNSPPVSQNVSSSTTSLFDLRSAQFGLAPEDKAAGASTTQAPDPSDTSTKFSLVICAIVPPASSFERSDAFKQKQAQALLLYHLRRYAASLKATLCFVRTTDEQGETDEQRSLNLNELSQTWLALATGKEIMQVETDKADAPESNSAAVYTPGMQEDLIETVLLRNAHCQGEWDAALQSLWVALPPKSAPVEALEDGSKVGDDDWLSQLRDSIGSLMKAPAEAAEISRQSQEQKEDDAEVSSFFENLLK